MCRKRDSNKQSDLVAGHGLHQKMCTGILRQVGALTLTYHCDCCPCFASQRLHLVRCLPRVQKQRQPLALRPVWTHLQLVGRQSDLVVKTPSGEDRRGVVLGLLVASGRSRDVLLHCERHHKHQSQHCAVRGKRNKAASAVPRQRMA